MISRQYRLNNCGKNIKHLNKLYYNKNKNKEHTDERVMLNDSSDGVF